MKFGLTFILFLAFTFCLLSAEVSLDFFSTKSDGKDVTVEWKSTTEVSVVRFEIERSIDNQTFRTIGTVEARGANQSYRFVDMDVLMKQVNGQQIVVASNFYYRLRFVGTDNTSSYSNTSIVSHNISSVRRTWGMIKEMFR